MTDKSMWELDDDGRPVAPKQTPFEKTTLEKFLEENKREAELASERLTMHMEGLR